MIVDECLQTEHDFTVARHGISWKFVHKGGKKWNIACERARFDIDADFVYLNADDIEFGVESTGCGTIRLHDFTIAYKGVKE